MANIVRVRVELKQYNPHASYDDRDMAFRKMFTAFKKACSDNVIAATYKEKSSFESKSRKRRRKQRESERQRLKTKLKENFSPQGKKKAHDNFTPQGKRKSYE